MLPYDLIPKDFVKLIDDVADCFAFDGCSVDPPIQNSSVTLLGEYTSYGI